MRSRVLAALVLCSCAGHAPAPAEPLRGVMAPDFTVTDLAAHPVQLSALRGRRVVLDFWESTCAPCQRAIPRLAALAASHDRLVILSITPESAQELRPFVAHHAVTWTIATDEADASGTAYRVAYYPTYFLVDAHGTIACARCSLDEIEQQLAAR